MKNQIKFLLILSSLILALVSVSCKNELKENPTYYTVSFDSDGGSFVASQTVESGKTAVEPRSPAKSGYTFDDWYKGSSVFDFSTPITSDLMLKAKWTKIQNNDSKNDNNTEENGNENKTDEIPPAEVSDLTVTENHKRIILNWINPADEDFASVEITCEPAEGSLSEPQKIQGNPTEEKSYTISNLENGKEYKITIKTIDSNNNKSAGVTKTASPKESKINLEVSLPNDDGENVILTNDKATINVSISPADKIVKAVWKKGGSAGMSDGDALLSDDSATVLVFNSNTASFTVTENGYYDIAVRNSEGVTECIRTEIKTIDKTPLAEVTNLTSESDGQNIYVSWENPASQNKYDSPLKTVILSYVYNDDTSDESNGEITLNAGEEQATIPIAVEKTDEDFVRITVKVVDELGNVSQGYKIQQACDGYVYITSQNEYQKIKDIRKSGKIVITGDVEDSKFWMGVSYYDENGGYSGGGGGIYSYLWEVQENNPDIRLDLDLSGLIVQQQATVSNLSGLMEKTSTFFYGLTCLNSIILPEGITIIQSFDGCSNLTSIVIPESVTTIERSAFYNCYNLTNIVLPAGLTSIEQHAFFGSGLTNIEIPDNVTNIGVWAFENCENLANICIPDSVTSISIEYGAFKNCSALTSITIPSSVQSIGMNAFENCSNLETVTIMSSSIGSAAFKNCSKLRNITLADSVTGIENNAFENCSNLKAITIPDSVTRIGKCIFHACSSLEEISVPFINGYIGSLFGKENFNNSKAIVEHVYDSYTPTTYYIPASLRKISVSRGSLDSYAFYNCSNLTTIILKSITSIGSGCFENCTNLESIIIPEGPSCIFGNTFKNSTNLVSITIPSSVIKINKNAFAGCQSLVSAIFIDEHSNWDMWEEEVGNYRGTTGEMNSATENARLLREHPDLIFKKK